MTPPLITLIAKERRIQLLIKISILIKLISEWWPNFYLPVASSHPCWFQYVSMAIEVRTQILISLSTKTCLFFGTFSTLSLKTTYLILN